MPSLPWRPGKRVAIVGGGPGAISTGLAFVRRGYDVRIFERQPSCKAIGGAVLLCVPRVKLPFNPEIEKRMGIKGWHYGVLRSSAFKRMLELIPEGVLHTAYEFISYTEHDDSVDVEFKNGAKITADILVGADGIRSGVSRQAFGDPKLFHTGIRLWLAWCDQIPGIEPTYGYPGFEWWVVEPLWEDKPVPNDVKAHLSGILKNWADPMPRFPDATNFDTQVYRWEIYNRPSLKKWSKGRVVCVGDAVHPLVDYVNHNTEFARFLGKMFHGLPYPLAWIRDTIFDYTPFLKWYLAKGYLKMAEKETMNLKELHVTAGP
ncbi:hypothetical protein EDB80DRAFT_836647 [Ilyonectria destructans]|nr:hypothetical protein EDB80DRAFT_836647 [Ilyonectria destructans]